jgi:FixJ family two-component response regulator
MIATCEPRELELRLRCFGGRFYRFQKVEDEQILAQTRRTRSDNYGQPDEELVKSKGSIISVVDDDESVRESLPDLLREFGFKSMVFSSAEEFLSSDSVNKTQCLILDIAMPGMSGPDLQRELARRKQGIPIIFITASRSASIRSRLLKQGAVECLFKPFTDSALLDALNAALAKS